MLIELVILIESDPHPTFVGLRLQSGYPSLLSFFLNDTLQKKVLWYSFPLPCSAIPNPIRNSGTPNSIDLLAIFAAYKYCAKFRILSEHSDSFKSKMVFKVSFFERPNYSESL